MHQEISKGEKEKNNELGISRVTIKNSRVPFVIYITLGQFEV